ncbi:MAG: DUF4136 domain-containing protein [Deltaproteobacteria bacterium]|nr:DUF4136 domain-containing protein [Deltaproteobacteria bacterium]
MVYDSVGRMKGVMSLALALMLFGCATVSVQTNYDRNIDFGRYRTFGWIGAHDQPKPPPEWVDKLVRTALEQELLKKGYQKANGREPDFSVAYHAAVEEKAVWQLLGPGTLMPGECVRRFTYLEGTLLIEFVDSRSNQAVWRGCASDVVGDRERAQRQIPAAIKQMLERFPPKQ